MPCNVCVFLTDVRDRGRGRGRGGHGMLNVSKKKQLLCHLTGEREINS